MEVFELTVCLTKRCNMSDIYVVIPVYNAEKYLEDTVRSVLMQPCAVAGIVLVDDGSTDASGHRRGFGADILPHASRCKRRNSPARAA